ncbi:MAG: hypothetical protein WC721_16315 [Victivallaceae bacterium]|jgi:hypothetical protein
MKKTGLVLMMCFSMLANVPAVSLLDFVPDNADLILGLRVTDSLNLPLVKEMRASDKDFAGKYTSFEKELEKNGLSVKDMPPLAVIFGRQDRAYWGIVMDATIPEARFVELLKTKLKSGYNIDYTVEKVNGQTVYCLENKPVKVGETLVDSGMIGQRDMKKIGVFYLNPDVALITDYQEAGRVMDEIKKGSCRQFIDASGINQQSLAWILYHPSMPSARPADASSNGGMPEQAGPQPFKSMGMALNFNGSEQKDIALDAVIDCKNKNSAAMMAMQAQGMVMLGLSSAFKDNPALAADVGNALKVQADGSKVKANLQLPEKLHKQVKDYLMSHGPDSQASGDGELDAVPAGKPVPLNKAVPAAKPAVAVGKADSAQ